LRKAASVIDTAHGYIVLLPGSHTSGAAFVAKMAIVAGNSATVDVASSGIEISGSSSVRFRDIILNINNELTISGGRIAISAEEGTEVAFDNVRATLIGSVHTIRSDGTLTIRNSTISRGNVIALGPLVVDRAVFINAQLQIILSGEAFEVSNSLFMSPPGTGGILINQAGASNQDGALVLSNTFVGASISCQGTTSKHIESNIFYNSTLSINSDCLYDYNLITPNMDVGGVGNKTGDPLFVDPTKNDFHLSTGSPAIDAASPNRPPPFGHDHDGVSRPQGARADIGAFERVSPAL
jgi:hypothetical protein